MFLSKLYIKKFEEIELHALGDAIWTSLKVANHLENIKEATITKVSSLILNPDAKEGET